MPRILVADDNTNIQKMVALAFHDRGIDVTAVGNGEAAVRRLPELNPDLILADIFMPVRSGYELCEWVKKDPKFSHIPVILLVGAFDPLDEKEARRVGADGVLKKPFIPPDPLIAMVTSALEKNSAISSEAAKPRETAAVPPPAPVPAVEIPAKIEVKPQPEFPEPSPEDASLAYGFGSGRRTLDDEGPGGSAEPPAPIAEADKEPEEEFEGASTTKDWRRSAMEFEIPEETSRRPAFSSDEELGPTFPSEKVAPPRNIPIPEPLEKIQPVAQKSSQTEPPLASWPVVAEVESKTETPIAAIESPQIAVSEPVTPVAPALALEQMPETEIQDAPAVETQASPEPSLASKAAHWMDLMASPSEKPQGNWFTSIFGSRKHADTEETPGQPSFEKAPAIEEPAASNEPEAQAESHAEVQTDSRAEVPLTPFSAGGEAAVALEHVEAAPLEDEPFFADEAETSEPASAVSSAIDEKPAVTEEQEIRAEIPAEAQARVEEIQEPIEPTGEIGKGTLETAPSIPSSSVHAGPPAELVAEASHEPTLAKDPALVEPPAVHVTPEPLLIDESPRGTAIYGTRAQEIAPLYSFLSAMPKTPAPVAVTEEPLREHAVAQELPPQKDESGALEFSSAEFDEPISTAPPINREALAEIPYLNPPASFHRSEFGSDDSDVSGLNDTHSSAPATVDEIVQKVLERIEPQIRELLSQNVLKPLVENLLQSELEKKDR